MDKRNDESVSEHSTVDRTNSIGSANSLQIKPKKIWRSPTFFNFLNKNDKKSMPVFVSARSQKDDISSQRSSISIVDSKSRQIQRKALRSSSADSNIIVIIVLVEAKCLPPISEDGVSHRLYCKFRLGTENYKTKTVATSSQPQWGERFKLHFDKDELLNISVWDKGKQKNFMGSCILDLSNLERERTHELWQQLDDGYGMIHFSVTMCTVHSNSSPTSCLFDAENFQGKHNLFNLNSGWDLVGVLHVNILGARGLVGKPNAYCTLELDNERVQTQKAGTTSEPTWDRCYVFHVYDVSSTLDLKVYDSSLTNALLNESIGKVSIPLLRIVNGQHRWYALKNRNRRNIAKGNSPRVCLQMTLIWNPIKASMRLFRPRAVKYVKKSSKFDIALVYSNIEFTEKVFKFLYEINEHFKRLFEWEDREYSFIALVCWLAFLTYFQFWAAPLLLLLPFIYHWFCNRYQDNTCRLHDNVNPVEDALKYNDSKRDKRLTRRFQDLPQMTLTITNGIEYLDSVAQRIYNLVSFKVPFLSYLVMLLFVIASIIFYFVPFKYLLMCLGIYKFTRKYLNPDRVLNNDLLDFISRIPDNEILKDWKELSVPEPMHRQFSGKLERSISTEAI